MISWGKIGEQAAFETIKNCILFSIYDSRKVQYSEPFFLFIINGDKYI